MKFLVSFSLFVLFHFQYSTAQYTPRQDVLADYEENFVNTQMYNHQIQWTGSSANCDPGTIQNEVFDNTLKRINFFRRLVGVDDDIVWNQTKHDKCQDLALMLKLNGLSHNPPSSWTCYTSNGAQAAGASNISTSNVVVSIERYIADATNTRVGHRRWLLFPFAKEMGMGSTNNSSSIWVVGDFEAPTTEPAFVAYPSPGYFPDPLEFPRWSFSKRNGDFSSTNIILTDENGDNIPVSTEPLATGVGDNTIVFLPSISINTNYINGLDTYIKVEVNNVVVGGQTQNYEYEVLIIPTTYQEAELTIQDVSCLGENGSCMIEDPHGYNSIKWSSGEVDVDIVEDLMEGDYHVTVTDKLGLEKVIPFQINRELGPTSEISSNGLLEFCDGDSVALIASAAHHYSWSTGDTTEMILAQESGTYQLIAYDEKNCSDTSSVIVTVFDLPLVDSITGNFAVVSNATEFYSIEENANSKYHWEVLGGDIVGPSDMPTVEVQWALGVSDGQICVREINQMGCESIDFCHAVMMLSSSSSIEKETTPLVSPNPANDYFVVQSNLHSIKYVSVFNLNGKLLRQMHAQEIYDIVSLPKGLYILEIKMEDNEYFYTRLLKQ